MSETVRSASSPVESGVTRRRHGFPIVGIGAPASGFRALAQLLAALPADTGMGFVVVQSLDSEHARQHSRLLSRESSMPVHDVDEARAVEPDQVYLIPPGKSAVITKGRLEVSRRRETRAPHRPIDTFLRSLARDQGRRAIAVILPGTGSDGSLGLETIEARGGIALEQDGRSEHEIVLGSASGSSEVEPVLAPRRIAAELARIARHPFVDRVEAPSEGPDAAGFAKIVRTLGDATGADLSHYRSTTLYRRIARRMLLRRVDEIGDYCRLLGSEPGEVRALYQDVLVNVTSFFRDAEAFEILKKQVFGKLLDSRQLNDPLRVWVLGCSTGEEAYSLAIALSEFAEEHERPMTARVFATDLNDLAIRTARAGIYPKVLVQGVSPERLRRWFIETENGYQIEKSIRDMCIFARHNVLIDPPFSRMDLVSCRNVLIYMEAVLRRRVLPLLHYSLKPGGYLWLGASETVGSFSSLFHAEDPKHRIYRTVSPRMARPFQFEKRMAVAKEPPAGENLLRCSEWAVREIAQLNDHLASTREYIQVLAERHEAVNEALHSANEAVQSSNEKLQDLNDELQTSREELHSSNEELATVNEELRSRNEELREAMDDLTNFLSSTNLALVKVSVDLRIRSFTSEAERLLRLIPADVGRSIGDIKPPFPITDLEASLRAVIESAEPVEREVLSEAGHWYSLGLRPFRTANGRIDGAVIVLVNLDAQKRALELLRDTDKRKDEFLAVLAHELRTPLTSLALGFELYDRVGSAALDGQAVDAMKRQVGRLRRLVDDLLDVARIAQGTVTLRTEPVDLVSVVQRSCEAMRTQIECNGRYLSVVLPSGHACLHADPVRLDQIVTNLLSNAAKFTDAGGRIELRLALESRPNTRAEAVITVRDDGIGIERTALREIFTLYTRSRASVARDRQGVGVGLYLVKRLVELHNGSVMAASDGPGKGSEFVVRIPGVDVLGARPPEPDRAKAERRRKSPQGARRRVLVVDDDTDAASAVAAIFRKTGQHVCVAHDGSEVLELAGSFGATLIVLDVGLPGLDGYAIARRLRESSDFDDVVIVALTGYGHDADRQRALEAGFDAYLVKPATFAALEGLLELRRSGAEPK